MSDDSESEPFCHPKTTKVLALAREISQDCSPQPTFGLQNNDFSSTGDQKSTNSVSSRECEDRMKYSGVPDYLDVPAPKTRVSSITPARNH